MASIENSNRKLTRKMNKPLMERKRRERINVCLDQLKTILMNVTKKESSFYSKLEKADILEMTVKYMHNISKHNSKYTLNSDETSRYISGFTECIREVTTYLSSTEGLDKAARDSILDYISNTLLKAKNPTGSPSLHGYDPNPPFDVTSLLPYYHVGSYTMTSHPEYNHRQEVSSRSQVTSSPKNLASSQENYTDVIASTKSWIEGLSLPPIRNVCLHEQNSSNDGKIAAQTNVPMKVYPAWLASGRRVLLLTGSQSDTILPTMHCTGSGLIDSQTTSEPDTDVRKRESMSMDSSFVFASSHPCAILRSEPRIENINEPEAVTICDAITSGEQPRIVSTGSVSKSLLCRIIDSDDVIASSYKDKGSDRVDRNDWGSHCSEPEGVKLMTSSDVWRPW